jgi:hypothetical protein
MTKRIRILFLVSTLFLSARVSAQLMVTNISGIPLWPTPVIDTSSYIVSVDVFNADSANPFVDFIDIMFSANGHVPPATLVPAVGMDSILPLGTVTKSNQQFQLSPVNFDDGDNIVVIWPAAQTHPGIGDSTTIHIFFLSTGVDEINPLPVSIYPNPATEYLYLGGLNEFKLKRVRILDAIGKEVYSGIPVSELISIKNLTAGSYVIAIESTDGRQRMIQFVKK